MQINRIGGTALILALLFVVASVVFTNHLAHEMAVEEAKIIEIWAEATRQIVEADEHTNIDFFSSIIEDNTSIPVYMLDGDGNILQTRNVRHEASDPTTLHGPIEVNLNDETVQYIYYDDSYALRQLRIVPYIEFGLIVLFVLIAIAAIYTGERGEKNRLWAGLSKETAHQLGTPISSLMAWQELLQAKYPSDELVPQIHLDIERLQVIADRFSKIGSQPELQPTPLIPLLNSTVSYMQHRISGRVKIEMAADNNMQDTRCMLSAPLFQWVIENLIKNAIDAMDANGRITIEAKKEGGETTIDVSDTGRGIEKSRFKRVFAPGYTTKKRGWGLGLSLSKRIIEDYHKGRLFVKQSQIGIGTTFRIVLRSSE